MGRRRIGFTLTLFLAGLWAISAAAEIIQARDVYVIDGDTIDWRGERVRLVGYDTPETYRAQCAYERALGDAAMARLRGLIAPPAQVELVLQPGRDRYGRLLGRLLVNGRDVGPLLIGEGLARAYSGGRRAGWC